MFAYGEMCDIFLSAVRPPSHNRSVHMASGITPPCVPEAFLWRTISGTYKSGSAGSMDDAS